MEKGWTEQEKNDNLVDGKYSIGDLVDLVQLQNIFGKFTRSTGFTIGFLDHPGLNILIATGWRDICTKFHRACPESIKNCKKSNVHLLDQLKELGQIVIEECDNGLVDCATPIIIKGKHIASLATGQLLLQQPDMERFRRQAVMFGYDEREYLEAIKEIPVVTEEKLRSVTSFLGEIAVVISELGYSNLLLHEKAGLLDKEISERKLIEEALRDSEEKYHSVMDNAADAILLADMDGKILDANKKAGELLGYTKDEFLSLSYPMLHPAEELERTAEAFTEIILRGFTYLRDGVIVRKNGKTVPVDITGSLIAYGDRLVVQGIFRDITERKRAEQEKSKIEEQLFQAQKMEAVGQLASGIAHDFNNILTAVIGYGYILKMKMEKDDPLRSYPDHILALSERAANLTRSLLAFSRKQIMNPKPSDLNSIIRKINHLLSRIIGEDIQLQTNLSENELIAMADPGQIEQVLMNLATNAKDAMPGGGLLTIRTETISVDSEFIRSHGFGKKGQYALITFTDTGSGMDRETKEKIFEPFFTTKEIGKGTGLGLAMVYGIIKQHEGHINVYSEPGKGTAFRIYLPLIEAEIENINPDTLPPLEKGTETILLAEDETEVRELTKHLLEDNGYQVITAADGQDAINKFVSHKSSIRLAILDVIMPGRNGKEVHDAIKLINPDIRVLFMSGYPADVIHRHGILEKEFAYIEKPPSPPRLLQKIREVLDQ